MQPSTPPRAAGHTPSSADLPYGPLPVRSRRTSDSSESTPLERLVDLSWLEPEAPPSEAPPPEAEVVEDAEPVAAEDASSDTALTMSVTTSRPETDDDVHFDVAAKALGVSRKTVERMVKRGQLDRGPSNAPATVSKRSLVAALEERRRDVSHLTRATEIERAAPRTEWFSRDSQDPASALREALVPVLAPLLDEFVAVRTRAAVLQSQLDSLMARAERERRRDELLLGLVTSGWWGRRKTRRAVLRHYIVGDDPPDPGSGAD